MIQSRMPNYLPKLTIKLHDSFDCRNLKSYFPSNLLLKPLQPVLLKTPPIHLNLSPPSNFQVKIDFNKSSFVEDVDARRDARGPVQDPD